MTRNAATDGGTLLFRRKRTQEGDIAQCAVRPVTGSSGLTVVELNPVKSLANYRAAMVLAAREANARIGEHMLLSWYDRDRNFESPQHASQCHEKREKCN